MGTTLLHRLRWPLRLAGVGLLTATAAIHLDLYLTGYRTIHVIGWLFLLQVIAGFALALAVLITPLLARSSWLPEAAAAAAGAIFAIATLGGYLLSLWVGLFGFREVRTTAGIVAGIIEIAAFAALALLAIAALPTASEPSEARASGTFSGGSAATNASTSGTFSGASAGTNASASGTFSGASAARNASASGTFSGASAATNAAAFGAASSATGAGTPRSAVPAERSDSAGAAATRPVSDIATARHEAATHRTGAPQHARTAPNANMRRHVGLPRRADGLRRVAVPGVAALSVAAIAVLGVSLATANGGTSGASATASTAVLRTDSVNGVTVLTNSTGLTLYWFAPDTSTSSACYGTCAAYWPPVYGTPRVASGVTGVTGKLGTIHRTDGTIQATYDGHPLYTYIGDTAPGQASGNDVNLNGGFWYEVRATP
jgi:predicted lipoprotein with Yx(FWY)xxD motif